MCFFFDSSVVVCCWSAFVCVKIVNKKSQIKIKIKRTSNTAFVYLCVCVVCSVCVCVHKVSFRLVSYIKHLPRLEAWDFAFVFRWSPRATTVATVVIIFVFFFIFIIIIIIIMIFSAHKRISLSLSLSLHQFITQSSLNQFINCGIKFCVIFFKGGFLFWWRGGGTSASSYCSFTSTLTLGVEVNVGASCGIINIWLVGVGVRCISTGSS